MFLPHLEGALVHASGQCQGMRELTLAGAAPDRGEVTGQFPFLETSAWAQPQGVVTSNHSLTKYVLSIVHPEAWCIRICYSVYSCCYYY